MSDSKQHNGRVLAIIIIAFLTGMTTGLVRAQGLGNAPYSSLGLGEVYGSANIANLGMGGIGISNSSNFYLNSQNPALLARRQRFTIFEVGLLGQTKSLTQFVNGSQQAQRSVGGNLNYLALAFPGSSRWNMAISLRPYSYVDYTTRQFVSIPGSPYTSEYENTGKGALNRASYASGVRLGKNVYVGAEASYVFGNVTTSGIARVGRLSEGAFLGSSDPDVSQLNRTNYKNGQIRIGGAWRPKLSEKWVLNLGATHEFNATLKAASTSIYQQSISGQSIANPDTLSSSLNGSVTVPQQTHIGISFEQPNKLTIGFDAGYQPWSRFVTASGQRNTLSDSYYGAAGLEYVPKSNSNKYWNLVSYRAGLRFQQTPYVIDGRRIVDISASVGLSLPIGSYLVNNLNIAVVGGQRGVVLGQQVREQYVKVALGVSLSDWWFRKPVLD
jgi:hypothetical protein